MATGHGRKESGRSQHTDGVLLMVGAYLLWGFAPIYWKQLDQVFALEILGHRIAWAVPFLLLLVSLQGNWSSMGQVLRQPRHFAVILVTASLVGTNWGIFVYSAISGQLLQASLGYFVNPLVSVFLGAVFLRERLRPAQWMACAIAAIGVIYLGLHATAFPWIAMVLAFSFGFYGLLRKRLPVASTPALSLETMILFLPALGFILLRESSGQGSVGAGGLAQLGFLSLAGPVTAMPLLLFGAGVRRIALSTAGFLQYIAPSIMFVLSVFVWDEPFGRHTLIAFLFIWGALGLYTWEGLWRARAARRALSHGHQALTAEGAN